LQIRIFGFFAHGTGYGEMARQLARAISSSGHDVCCKILQAAKMPNISLDPDMAQYLNTHQIEREPHISIYAHIPIRFDDVFRVDNGPEKIIGLTMSEGMGRLSQGYVDGCNSVDEVWIPTEYNRKIFHDSGVTVPLKIVPLGINIREWKPAPFHAIKNPSEEYVFLSNFSWPARYRKGADKLLSAYFGTFNSFDNVRLIIKTAGPQEEIERFLNMARPRKAPRITIANGFCGPEQIREVYQAADCFVLPTRSEAWGLPALEAMSCGLPVIITGEGSQLEFCNIANSILLKIKGYEKPPEYENLIYADLKWAEPDEKHLASLMKWAYNHRGAAYCVGQQGLKTARKFTWQHSADIAIQHLQESEVLCVS